jgi:hypothetical protein
VFLFIVLDFDKLHFNLVFITHFHFDDFKLFFIVKFVNLNGFKFHPYPSFLYRFNSFMNPYLSQQSHAKFTIVAIIPLNLSIVSLVEALTKLSHPNLEQFILDL